jgi:CRP/FNR family transcriptional regulator
MSHRRADDQTIPTRVEIIRQSEIGCGLDDETALLLARGAAETDVRRRRFVYHRGDVPDALYIVARGRVKLSFADGGREAVIDIVGPGALFGESALYVGAREKDAAAFENARLLRIPVGVYREGMGACSELYDCTFRLVGQRLARAERRVADFALDAIPARLDKLLVELCERYGRPETDGVLIDIALPHREIASIVGSTRESITVRLNALRRAGIIDFVDRKILIKRPAATAAI